MHQTWAVRNSQPKIPTRGQRNTQKILGAVSLYDGKFCYRHQSEYFNAQTWLDYLEDVLMPSFYKRRRRVYLVLDNASYHKKQDVFDWYENNRKKLEVFFLPAYCPELNPVERIWQYVRKNATHNRYFDTKERLCETLFATLGDIQNNPEKIMGRLRPYF